MNDERVPAIAYSGVLKVGDLEITVHVLDNGQRIIPEQDMIRALEWFGGQDESVIAEFKRMTNLAK